MADIKICFLLTILALVNSEGLASSSFIQTIPSVVGWKDSNIQLPCNFSGTPNAVYWLKLNKTDPNIEILKAYLWPNEIHSFDKRFEMSENCTLGIHDLVVADEGRYVCHVVLEDESDFEIFTDLKIYAYSENIVINQCVNHTDCTYQWRGSSDFALECTVSGFRPNLTSLVWTTADQRELQLTKDVQRRLPDETWDRVVSITANAKDKEQNFICTAGGDAVNGTASTGITILPLLDKKSLSAGGIAGIVLATLIVLLFLTGGYFICKSRREQSQDESNGVRPSAQPLVTSVCEDPEDIEIRELRKKIGNYKPGDAEGVRLTADASAVNISLFGIIGVGKSAFFNSLIFAFTGTYEILSQEVSKSSTVKSSEDQICHHLTKNIKLTDNRGKNNFTASYMNDLKAQVGGTRGTDNEIHCIVFVYEYNEFDWFEAVTLLNRLFEKVFDNYGPYPLFVFTHGNSAEWTFENLKERLKNENVPEANIWMFENYTSENHEEDKKRSVKFLKFLWDALKQCDLNNFRMGRKKKKGK